MLSPSLLSVEAAAACKGRLFWSFAPCWRRRAKTSGEAMLAAVSSTAPESDSGDASGWGLGGGPRFGSAR